MKWVRLSPAPDEWWRRPFAGFLLKYVPSKIVNSPDFRVWAARFGHVEILQQCLDEEIDPPRESLNCQAAVSLSYAWSLFFKLVVKSTKAGILVKTWLQRHCAWLDIKIICWAVRHNQLPLLKFLFTHMVVSASKSLQFSVHEAIATASVYGHLPVLKWLHANANSVRVQLKPDLAQHNSWKGALPCAAKGGHIEILKWLQANKLVDWRLLKRATKFAIQSGN